ncbi:hypothetical protein F5Y19DRAFT_81106 [Xylariaceae sp. FL1651]|nr:hypothetical protein F5Y19DRAFT_81106 [Xylariaceae sp. FL1651]
MAEHFTRQFIPAGCLLIDTAKESKLPSELLCLCEPQQWYFFVRKSDILPPPTILSNEVQNALLASPSSLTPFILLWNQGWIQLAFTPQPSFLSSQVIGRVRVYILPHDVNRSMKNPRSELTRLMSTLLSQLEYSPECWHGKGVYTPQSQPAHGGGPTSSAESDRSLLAIFNQVPSPDPRPETVFDPGLQYAMQSLLESQVSGLSTPLYPYQGRSAALMLQRELEPGRVIDPRFRSVLDQAGQLWYFDDVSGLVLKEPRFYDAARGGILAEEMGTGKTLICLALILSTRSEPSRPPDPFIAESPSRQKMGSLMDMAAAAANKHSIPWKPYFEACAAQLGYEYQNCKGALTKPENLALYKAKNNLVEPRRSNRTVPRVIPSKDVYLSHLTLVIVPSNLIKQWQNEIKKHTTGLNVVVVVEKDPIPPVTELLLYDILLFSETRFERIQKERSIGEGRALEIYCPLEYIHFKRCIIDEGHKLGNGSRAWKNDVMRVIERLEISARWVVTGTPSRGLYGVQPERLIESGISNMHSHPQEPHVVLKQEREDLQRIGNLTAKYLKIRPWANAKDEAGDKVADWGAYVKGHNRKDCLITTVNSLLIRHQLADVSTLLPPVNEKIVVLDGCFQDQLSLNLFSMMIIFNSVQSQRTDVDYFFHERQRKNLIQLVKNLRQASFFGGVFFSTEDIVKAVETAESFLEKKAVPISSKDEDLLRQAIEFGKKAARNHLKDVSNRFHALPLYLRDFPGGKGKPWSLDEGETEEGFVCTDAGLIHSLQKFINPCIDAPTSLKLLIDSGRLDQQGVAERAQALALASNAAGGTSQAPQMTALAGNTALGNDHHNAPKLKNFSEPTSIAGEEYADLGSSTVGSIEVAEPLAKTRIISTASAKLSYLINSIIKYQNNEQILIFYDNDNVAFYLASVLEVLQIQHLIYSRAGLSAERRAQYVATFTNSPKFRVLLMDISQAAFGLDMRSASRIYFISPVLNPQVVAQAIGRARRISQKKPVFVETLVLRNSIEEVVVDRREHMTQAEHSRIKNVLDDGKIKEWIRNPNIIPISDREEGLEQTALLAIPQYVFGRGFGRALHPDEGLVTGSPEAKNDANATRTHGSVRVPLKLKGQLKRPFYSPERDDEIDGTVGDRVADYKGSTKRRARIAWVDQEA